MAVENVKLNYKLINKGRQWARGDGLRNVFEIRGRTHLKPALYRDIWYKIVKFLFRRLF